MINIKLTNQQADNLIAFLTGYNRLQIYGSEAFEFVDITNTIIKSIKDSSEEKVKEE